MWKRVPRNLPLRDYIITAFLSLFNKQKKKKNMPDFLFDLGLPITMAFEIRFFHGKAHGR